MKMSFTEGLFTGNFIVVLSSPKPVKSPDIGPQENE
jgi:hypothetical protein